MRVKIILLVIALVVAACVIGGPHLLRRYATPPVPERVAASRPMGDWDHLKFHRALSPEERGHVLDGQYAIVTSAAKLPDAVKQAFATITGGEHFLLANPGEKYQVTDVIDEPGLPFRRLVFAGACGTDWFIHYEHGGIGHSYAVMVLRVRPGGRTDFVWGGAGSYRATGFEDLRRAIASGRFDDRQYYYW